MGSGNSPLDIVTMKKGNDSFLVMANSSRPVFKVKYKNIEIYQGSLTTPVEESFATPVTNVIQLDKLDDTRMIMLQRRSNGNLDLWTSSDRYL
jgi:hypothetical protein